MHRLRALAYSELTDAEHESDPELLQPAPGATFGTYLDEALRSIWSKQ